MVDVELAHDGFKYDVMLDVAKCISCPLVISRTYYSQPFIQHVLCQPSSEFLKKKEKRE